MDIHNIKANKMKTNAYRDLLFSQQIHNKYGSRVVVKESIIEMPRRYFV